MRNEQSERPWVKKFETGEYLRKWKGFEPILIGGAYSSLIGIGEENFSHCIGGFSGIGEVSWWFSEELDRLSVNEILELNKTCQYKSYIDEFISHELIVELSSFYKCETFHIHRVGAKAILDLVVKMSEFRKLILESSKNCLDEKTIQFNSLESKFELISFENFQ